MGVAQRLSGAFLVALIGLAAAFVLEGKPLLAPFGVGLALFVITGAVTDICERIGLLRTPLATVLRRAAGLPRSAWGTAFAHLGLGITLLGIVGETQWGAERIVSIKPGDKVTVRNYDVTFDRTFNRTGPNYTEIAAAFTVRRHGEIVGFMEPSKRNFASRQTTTTESALMARGVSQLYLSLGEINPDGSVAIRLYYKPLVLLIWLGCVVMVLGGGLSLSDRRLRVGAPKPARAKTAAMAPAE
jgi:cytochrome c-type biogenesis protein CcmF